MTTNDPYLAKYPFLEDAKDALADFDMQSALRDEDVQQRAAERIITGVNKGTITPLNDSEPGIFRAEKGELEIEMQSYPVARMLVSIIEDYRIITSYAQAEAETARIRIKHDIETDRHYESKHDIELDDLIEEFNLNVEEANLKDGFENTHVADFLETATSDTILEFAESVFDIPDAEDKFSRELLEKWDVKKMFSEFHKVSPLKTELEGRSMLDSEWYTLDVPSYLRFATGMDDEKWRLTNRGVVGGRVFVTLGDLIDLIEQAIYLRVSENLPHEVPEDIDELLFEAAETVREGISDDAFSYEIDRVEEGLFPPVIKQMLEDFPHGLEHEEKVTLGSFLIHIGMTVNEAVEFVGVKGTPGEDPTTYQMNHIASGGGTGEPYTPANYQTIEAWGYEWEKDALEAKVKNPLTYYKIKLKEEEDSEEEDSEENPDEVESVETKNPDEDEKFAPSQEDLKADLEDSN